MAGIDPLQMQRERQQRARAEQERQGLLASPSASKWASLFLVWLTAMF